MEDLVQYLLHGAQRVELAPLNLVEQPPQLGVVGDDRLEMALRARRRDREHLAGEVAARGGRRAAAESTR